MSGAPGQHTAVVGMAWGDEGKGKVVDMLSPHYDAVVRYNGGANAGHTVRVGDEVFALHLLPAGVLHEGVTGVIGQGVAVDPAVLLAEIDELAGRGIDVTSRLRVSDRAHVVTEYHKVEDRLSEQAAGERERIGTTARGIGPCYADKMKRSTALRVCDLFDAGRLAERVGVIVDQKRRVFQVLYGQDGGLAAEAVTQKLTDCAERLRPLVCDTRSYLGELSGRGGRLLFEAANGMLLDIDHGTYPFVTSSHPGPWGIWAGAGVPPQTVRHCVGVVKAYATRVGAGPFPSELHDATGERIRDRGHEYGTTTGRPRRCGWFDAVAVRQSVCLGAITEVALMHLDTLCGFDGVGICTGYRLGGKVLDALPADSTLSEGIEPVVEFLPGWGGDWSNVSRFEELPAEAIRYVERIESLLGAPVSLVGVGPERSQSLARDADGSVFATLALGKDGMA